jgi:PKD repeat protein
MFFSVIKKSVFYLFLLISSQCFGQTFKWAFKTGGTSDDLGKGIALDAAGNFYCIGKYNGTTSFDSLGTAVTLTSAGSYDMYLVKYNCKRELQWKVSIGSSVNDGGIYIYAGIGLDASNNIYITSSFSGTCTWNSTTGSGITKTAGSSTLTNPYIAKYDNNGVAQWVQTVNSTLRGEGINVKVDPSGYVYATGSFSGSSTFSTTTGTPVTLNASGSTDLYLARYTSDGDLKWVSKGGGPGEDLGTDISFDRDGNIFVSGAVACCGAFNVTFGGTTSFTGSGVWDAIVAKCDSTNGNWVWLNHASSSGADGGAAVIVDSVGDVYLLGGYNNNCTWSTTIGTAVGPRSSAGGIDIYMAKYDNDGELMYVATAGGTGNDDVGAATLSDSGYIFITGYFNDTVIFGTGQAADTVISAGLRDIYIVKYDGDSLLQWAQRAGGSLDDESGDIVTDQNDDFLLSGAFSNTLSFGKYTLTTTGNFDALFAKSGYPQFFTLTTSDTVLCPGDSTLLVADSLPGFTYSWQRNGTVISGETTRNLLVKTAGTYKVFVTSTCNETDSGTLVITVNQPVANYVHVDTACLNTNVIFADLSSVSSGSISSYLWDFGDGDTSSADTTVHVFTNDSAFAIKLKITSSAGCVDSLSSSIFITTKPVASFTAADKCADSAVVFTNTTTNSGNPFASLWFFGNGDTSTATNPQKNYNDTGAFQVKLIVGSANGCIDSVTKTVNLFPLPVTAFTFTNRCKDSAIVFTDQTTISSGTVSWNWFFSDTTSSAAQNPSKTFSSSGVKFILLIATSDKGCRDSSVMVAEVYPKPEPAFTYTENCTDPTFNFTDRSTIDTGSVTGWNWSFGDSSSSIVRNPTHLYTSTGIKSVTLRAVSDMGCVDSLTQSVLVLPAAAVPLPLAQFSFENHCMDSAILFEDESTVPGGSIVSWRWDFGDTTFAPVPDTSHIYITPGPRNVKLVIVTDHGCKDSITQVVAPYDKPIAAFSFTDRCRDTAISFIDNSNPGNSTIVSWYWDFGNGTSDLLQNPSKLYGVSGFYDVMLRVVTDHGCRDSVTHLVSAHPLPSADFTFVNSCVDSAIVLTDISTVDTGSIVSWAWDFADGNNSAVQHPSHLYAVAGSYNVRLTVFSDKGCRSNNRRRRIDAWTLPVSDFVFADKCADSAVNFTDTSTISSGSIISWDWTFGSSGTANTQNASHQFPGEGNYPVTLVTTSDHGCKGTIGKLVTIHPLPVVDFQPTAGCRNSLVNFTNTSTIVTGANVDWIWDLDDGGSATTEHPTFTYALQGTKQVRLTVTSDFGCRADSVKDVTIHPTPAAAFGFQPVCQGSFTPFVDQSTLSSGNISSWIWDFGDGGNADTSRSQNPQYIYSDSGNFIARMIIVTNQGCRDTAFRTVKVYANPIVDFTTSVDNGCEALPVDFIDNSTVADGTLTGWDWSFGDGNFAFEQNPVHVFEQDGTYGVSLTVRSSLGCATTTLFPDRIVVYPNPVADFIASPDSISFLTPTIAFTDLTTNSLFWDWDFGDNTGSTLQNPVHDYTDTGRFIVRLAVRTNMGCVDTTYRRVVLTPFYTFYIPDAFTPNKDLVNDVFAPVGIFDGLKSYEMMIFNRWGATCCRAS